MDEPKQEGWYARWSANRLASRVHWAIFIASATFAFFMLYAQVEDVSRSIEESNLAAAAPIGATKRAETAKPFSEVPEARDIIIAFKPSVKELRRAEIARLNMLAKRKELSAIGATVYSVGEEDSAHEVVDRVRMNHKNDILYVEADEAVATEYLPNDPQLGSQWHISKIAAPDAWEKATGEGVLVAILDTGVDCAHQDLILNCTSGWNVVSNSSNSADVYGHGTKVAGTVAAVGDNAAGVAGVAYRSKILPVRISDDPQGLAYYSDMADGVIYAADQGAKVVNLSYIGYPSQAIVSAAQYLAGKGGMLTVSAGNSGTESTVSNDPNIIVVSATDMGDARASWSNFGAPVDIAAPGLAIYTTAMGGGVVSMSGTSFSAPIAAGVIAVLRSSYPNVSASDIASALFSTAQDLGAAGWDKEYGWGRVDAARAMIALLNATTTTPTVSPQPNPPTTPTTTTQTLAITGYAVIEKTKTSGTVTWTTNLPSTGVVRYGTSPTALTSEVAVTTASVSQTAAITNLQSRAKYYYRIEATNDAGQKVSTPVTEFRTRNR